MVIMEIIEPAMNPVLTVFQAAKLCSVSPKTITNWIEAGHIRAYKTVGGHRRIDGKDLRAFMQRQGIPIPDDFRDHRKKRILVVDDDPIILETIVQALQEDENNYEVMSASDGFEAGLKVREFKPHLIILDIMMPGIRGDEVCRQIKSNNQTEDIIILVLSAYMDEDRFEQMKAYGADACYCKPLELSRLKQEVGRLLQGGK